MENIHVCPSCGEKSDIKPNYDYTKPNSPIRDIHCNQCGMIFADVNSTRLAPYQMLKSIFNEGELTQKGSANLDEILGIKKKENKPGFFQRIFAKIDSAIFKKPGKITNNPHKRLR